MTFLASTIDWFLGKRASHMGPDQYVAHAGMRDGVPTSGALLWALSENKTVSSSGNMVNAETALLQRVARDIGDLLPVEIPIVELGPGTPTAFKNKTLPIARALGSRTCILVDESMAFLKQIAAANDVDKTLTLQPLADDFFENEEAYFHEEALVCSFGSTISNFLGPLSPESPQAVLVNGLSKLACAAEKGWMLIAFDSDHDSERIRSFYKAQALFQLNIFDRMAAELPIKGEFDPAAFHYEPEWIESAGQLAHVAVVDRTMNFTLGGIDIVLQAGRRLHIKNSYKFRPAFFERCCALAGLDVVTSWSDDSPAKIYLLKIPPKERIERMPQIFSRSA